MFEKMLIAVDHSEHSERAVAAAVELAKPLRSEVFVLHLRERELLGRGGLPASEADTEASEKVDEVVAKFAEAGVTAHGEVRNTLYGHAAKEILDAAHDHGVSLIVMGSRGRSELAGLVLGSTSHKVLHLGDVPVLVVH